MIDGIAELRGGRTDPQLNWSSHRAGEAEQKAYGDEWQKYGQRANVLRYLKVNCQLPRKIQASKFYENLIHKQT